ncbi:hypothetical protein FOL47_011226, partial [Perkinsus chesapeaki]
MYFRTDMNQVSVPDLEAHFRSLGAKDCMVVHHSRGHTYGLAAFTDSNEMHSKLASASNSSLGLTRTAVSPETHTSPSASANSSIHAYTIARAIDDCNDSSSPPVDSVLSNDSSSPPVDSILSNDSSSPPVDSVLSNDSSSPPVDSVLSNDSSSSPVDPVLSSDAGACRSTPAFVSECNVQCDDVVRSLQILPEVTLNADFCGTSVRCVVDSAAGHSYIATSDVSSFNVSPKTLQDSFSVKVANGSIVRVGLYLPGLLTLLDHDQRQPVCSEYVHLRVLPSTCSLGCGEWPTILLGRDLMDQLSILVEARRCLRQGRVLYDYSSEVDNVRSLLASDDRVLRLATADVGKPVEAAEFVSLSVDSDGQKKAAGYCKHLETRRSFGDDQRGFYSTLVPLEDKVEERFPGCQTHQWQVCCPSPKTVKPSRRYADKMYSQLTAERRAQHDALVDQYLQRHHWSPAVGQAGPAAAEVFMVGGAGTSVKPRLVCDFRPLNSAIPKSSSAASFLPVVMAAVRLVRPHALVCADMHSAFYMLHLCDHDGCLNALQLRCGDGRLFESSRVCFGVGFGPEGLGCTLGRQREQILQDPPARMRNSDTSRPEFQQLQPFIRPKATTLGVTLAFRPLPVATLCLFCDRQDRLQAAREILAQDHWSKTEIYAAAGGIGHDPVGLHGLVKPYCDATRRLVGGVFSKVSWNKPLQEADFSKDQWLAWSTLRQCLLSHVDDHLLNRCIGGGISDNHDDVFSLAEFLHSQISHDLCFEPCGADCPRHIDRPEVPNDVSADCVRLLQEVNPLSATILCQADYVSRCLEIGSRLEADDNCKIISPVPSDQHHSSLISDVLRLCWGVNQCCSLVAVYHWCWKVWLVQARTRRLRGRRHRAHTRDFPDFPTLWDNDDLQFLLRTDQRSNSHIGTLSVCDSGGAGPYYRLDDLVYFRSNCSNGTVAYRAVVSDLLRDFVLRDIHRNYSHCGVTGMCSRFIEAFFCRALRSSAVRVRRQCPCCASLDARFAWALPIGGPYFNIRALLESPDYVSYSVVGIDFMTLAPGIKVLVCVCCATRHCTLLYLRKEDTRHALQGVRELSLSRGKPILLLSDRAAYFRSEEWSRSLRQQGIRAIHTASRSPWEGAVYERVNLEIRRVLKFLADIPKIQRLLKKFDPNSVNDTYALRMLLLEIELMCNTRPIGMSSGSSTFDDHMEVISPDRLAYGFQRRLDDYTRPVPLATTTPSPTTSDDDCPDFDDIIQGASKRVGEDGILPSMVETAPSRLSAIRNSFLSFHFQQLKDRSARQCGSNSRLPAHVFSVGEAVFVKNDKQIFGAHILELLPGKDKV